MKKPPVQAVEGQAGYVWHGVSETGEPCHWLPGPGWCFQPGAPMSGRPATLCLRLYGDWTQPPRCRIERKPLTLGGARELSFDCAGLAVSHSLLLAQLAQIISQAIAAGLHPDLSGLPPGMRRMLELSIDRFRQLPVPPPPAATLLERIGGLILGAASGTGTVLVFVGDLTLSWLRLCRGRSRMRWSEVSVQMQQAGPKALLIVSLIGFLMGIILAFIGSIPLKWFSAESYVASLLGIGILRLMGPVMVGVVMSGRTGAAYAAELGTMQVNEELDAYRGIGISPMEFLVLPRVLALAAMMPLLCLYANLLGLLGGYLVAVTNMGVSWLEYYQQLINTTRINDLLVGLFTAWVFGILVAVCGCYQGMTCGRNAEAVGRATTDAVVSGIVCIVVATTVITMVTVYLKI